MTVVQHPSPMPALPMPALPIPAPPLQPAGADAGRFVSLRLVGPGRVGPLTEEEVVLARLDDEPSPGSVVLARAEGRLEVWRVGRVDGGCVELLPIDDGTPREDAPRAGSRHDGDGARHDDGASRVVQRAREAVLGTVLLRWHGG